MCMVGKSAVELFSSWAEMGKDEGMETGHSPSVEFHDIESGHETE